MKKWKQQIHSALINAGTDWKYCLELALLKPSSEDLIELLTKVLAEAGESQETTCSVRRACEASILTKMLPFAQPNVLKIDFEFGNYVELRTLLAAVHHYFRGHLQLLLNESHKKFLPCDDEIFLLENAWSGIFSLLQNPWH